MQEHSSRESNPGGAEHIYGVPTTELSHTKRICLPGFPRANNSKNIQQWRISKWRRVEVVEVKFRVFQILVLDEGGVHI